MTYEQAIAYTQTRAPFTTHRTVDVYTAAQLKAAIAGLQPGDRVVARDAFTVAGETVIANRLASAAVIDLGTLVTFAYTGTSDLPAVWMKNPRNVRLYGGVLTTNKVGGPGMLWHGGQYVTWWGARVHDCGNTGISMFPILGPIDHCDVQAVVTNCGLNHAWDPHIEKGSGLHAVNLWDSDNSQPFTNNRFAFDVPYQPNGAAVEVGNGNAASSGGDRLYLRAANLTFVSKTQTGGNGLQLWGNGVPSLGLDVPYMEVSAAQGRALQCPRTDARGVKVDYGRATHTNLNPVLDQGRSKGVAWDKCGAVYVDVV